MTNDNLRFTRCTGRAEEEGKILGLRKRGFVFLLIGLGQVMVVAMGLAALLFFFEITNDWAWWCCAANLCIWLVIVFGLMRGKPEFYASDVIQSIGMTRFGPSLKRKECD